MIPNNRIDRFLSESSKLNRPADPSNREGENSTGNGEGASLNEEPDRSWDFFVLARPGISGGRYWQSKTAEIRIHAILNERLADLRRSRRGLWARIWGFIRGE